MYGTLIDTEYGTISKDIQNPDADRRCKYDWTKQAVIPAGTKFKLEIRDLSDDYREMWGDGEHNSKRGSAIMEELDKGWKFQRVVIKMKNNQHSYNVWVSLTFAPGEETAKVEYHSELSRLIYESLTKTEKTVEEQLKDAMDQCSVPGILVEMVNNGLVTVEQVREQYLSYEARMEAEWQAKKVTG